MFLFQAPEWVDSEDCHRCRVQFGVMTRKVHIASLTIYLYCVYEVPHKRQFSDA